MIWLGVSFLELWELHCISVADQIILLLFGDMLIVVRWAQVEREGLWMVLGNVLGSRQVAGRSWPVCLMRFASTTHISIMDHGDV